MRHALIAVLVLAASGAAAQDVTRAKPSWLASKPARPGVTAWTPTSQWPLCIAALTPAEDAAKAAALANYRALYFQNAVGQQGMAVEAAVEALKAVAKPPPFIAASCLKETPSAADRSFRTAYPWAKSYFDGALDREMFTPVPMTE